MQRQRYALVTASSRNAPEVRMLEEQGYTVDVVASRRQAEESLLEERNFMSAVLDTIGGLVVVLDPEGRIITFNRTCEQVTGYTFDEVKGRHIWDLLIPPEELDAVRSVFSELAVEHIPNQHEGEWITKDGSRRLIAWSNTVLTDDEGVTLYVIGTGIDVTERRQAERALRESEERYRAVVQDQTELICRWLPGGTLTFVNDAYCRYLGISCDQLIGHSFMPMIIEEDREKVQRHFASMTPEHPTASTEHRVMTPDGRIRWMHWNDRAIYDDKGMLIEYQSVGSDITERKQAEEALAQARADAEHRAAELESFISSIADGINIVDTDGKIIKINQAGIDILGVPNGVELPIHWMTEYERCAISGEQLTYEQSPTYQALQGKTVKDMRCRLVTPWGKEVVLSISASPIKDSQGRISGATIIFRDQSERVELERKREELLRRERHIANTLQQALVPPQVSYDIYGCRIVVKYQSAWEEAEIGGDFYDIFDLGDKKIGILIGDVAGKGLPAAIRVAAARYAVRSYAYLDPSPARVMTLANDALSREDIDGSGILTVLFAVVNTDEHTVTFANGGHEPAVLRSVEGGIQDVDIRGLILGVLPGYVYQELVHKFQPGEIIVMFTDGITEARSESGEFFDREGLLSYLADRPNMPLNDIPSGLMEAVLEHTGGSLQDDAAIVAFEINY